VSTAYIDTSAFVKLLVAEPGTSDDALARAGLASGLAVAKLRT